MAKQKKKKSLKRLIRKKDLEKRLNLYQLMNSLPKKTRCEILPHLSDDAISFLCEAIYNTVNVDLGLSKSQQKKLRDELIPCKNEINILCKKHTSADKRKKILCQRGGFLGFLLKAILPLVGGLLAAK